jgi:hypothetical protein
MKAITIMQPWASLIALKAKRYETRSWNVNYRGPIAIHASKEFSEASRKLARSEPFSSVLFGNEEDLPLGCIIAICNLTAVFRTADLTGQSAFEFARDDQSSREEAFGDFSPGRYAWLLTNIVALDEPIPARGALGLWEWDHQQLNLSSIKNEKQNAIQTGRCAYRTGFAAPKKAA